MNYEFIGEQLRLAREQTEMIQLEAAQALGITSAALSQYEAGKRRVDVLTLERLASLYNVSLNYFLGQATNVLDWKTALHSLVKELSLQCKVGIESLIKKVDALEKLYSLTHTEFPGLPHPPFAALREDNFSNYEVAEYADRARRYFDLGVAPLLNLHGFLDAQGYKIFTLPLGKEVSDLSGFFFLHPKLGAIVVLNEDQAWSRIPFTLCHELAHSLYHYDRPAILCRANDTRHLERFAERFASYFLIPHEALDERLYMLGIKKISRPEEIVHLGRYFGVSYKAIFHRLKEERRLDVSNKSFEGVKPVSLAKALGYNLSRHEFGERPLALEEKFPRVFLELTYRVLKTHKLSSKEAGKMLDIDSNKVNQLFDLDENSYYINEAEEIEELYLF
jgi:Zn-dependent peptidase ImmA (M78 family)/DNA-binding XRE family transcriptional regulator